MSYEPEKIEKYFFEAIPDFYVITDGVIKLESHWKKGKITKAVINEEIDISWVDLEKMAASIKKTFKSAGIKKHINTGSITMTALIKNKKLETLKFQINQTIFKRRKIKRIGHNEINEAGK